MRLLKNAAFLVKDLCYTKVIFLLRPHQIKEPVSTYFRDGELIQRKEAYSKVLIKCSTVKGGSLSRLSGIEIESRFAT